VKSKEIGKRKGHEWANRETKKRRRIARVAHLLATSHGPTNASLKSNAIKPVPTSTSTLLRSPPPPAACRLAT
jgi:hypothetical protein